MQQQCPSKWISFLAVIKFDIDEGQKIDIILPKKNIPENQQKEIAMLSFPDSNSLGDYEGTFKYVFKQVYLQNRLKNQCFGYTCFKQKKDPSNPRGYSQRSLVVMSFLPFTNFFLKISEFIVFKLFHQTDNLESSLQKLLQQMNSWPDPHPLQSYTLPILDYEEQIEIPNYIINAHEKVECKHMHIQMEANSSQFSLEQIVSKQSLKRIGPFQQIRLTETFDMQLDILWNLWEAVILNKKILVMGSNPFTVSQAVLGAISLVNPIGYHGQYSPYVTVFDTNLKRYQEQCESFIIGASNPLFTKLFTQKDVLITDISQSKMKENKNHPTNIIPVPELLLECKNEQQRAINQSTLRKYFYRLNGCLMSQVEQYVQVQQNVNFPNIDRT